MPYPSHLTREQIISCGRMLIEREGVEQFTLSAVAEALGVKTPSLYRYVDSKVALLQLINREFLLALFGALDDATRTVAAPPARLMAVFHAYREFARAHPRLYRLAFVYDVEGARPDEDFLTGLVLPLQRDFEAMSGAADSLAAVRGAFAFVHGWVMLELTNQLRRGGDLDADFHRAAEAYLAGWA